MSELPVQSSYTIPEQWAPTEHEGVDAVLLRAGDYPRFRPNILIETTELRPEAKLASLADFVVDRIRPTSRNVELLERQDVGSAEAESLFQAVSFQIPIDDDALDAMQLCTLFALADKGSGRQWACWLTLTALRDDIQIVGPEFQQIVASTRFEAPQPPHMDSNAQA